VYGSDGKTDRVAPSWISHTATDLLKLHTTETKPNRNPNTNLTPKANRTKLYLLTVHGVADPGCSNSVAFASFDNMGCKLFSVLSVVCILQVHIHFEQSLFMLEIWLYSKANKYQSSLIIFHQAPCLGHSDRPHPL